MDWFDGQLLTECEAEALTSWLEHGWARGIRACIDPTGSMRKRGFEAITSREVKGARRGVCEQREHVDPHELHWPHIWSDCHMQLLG